MVKKRPAKPYPDFPLRWHPQGYWIKKIKGRVHYFGERWGDWQAALDDYNQVAADLHAGREPSPKGLTVKELCESFLAYKETAVEAGEFAERSFRDYQRVAQMVSDYFGETNVETLSPADYGNLRKSISAGRSVISTANLVRIARMIFRFAETEDLIPGRIKFGSQFSEPSARAKKKHRAAVRRTDGLRMFEPAEVRTILYAASPVWRAMIYLGINCGWGNTDLAQLTTRQVGSVVDYPRPKTGETRRNVLWPETLAAVHQAIKVRPRPRSTSLADHVFLTKTGREWVRTDATYVNDEVSKQFSKLLKHCGLKRNGVGFYALRHTVVTVGEEIADKPALSLMLGHADNSMAASYRERIDDSRLKAISDHLLKWLALP